MVGNVGRFVLAGVLTSAAGLGFACSTSSIKPPIEDDPPVIVGLPTTTGGGDSGVATTSCIGADAGCNALVLCGTRTYVVDAPSAAPAPTGGTVTPGTYSMSSYTLYNGTDAGLTTTWLEETFQITAAGTEGAMDAGAEAGAEAGAVSSSSFGWLDVAKSETSSLTHLSGTLTVSGTSLTFDSTCPAITSTSVSYTATASSIIVSITDPGQGTGVITYSLSK